MPAWIQTPPPPPPPTPPPPAPNHTPTPLSKSCYQLKILLIKHNFKQKTQIFTLFQTDKLVLENELLRTSSLTNMEDA